MRTNKALKALKFGNIKHQILIKDCLDQGHRLLNQQNGLVSFHFRYCSTLDIVFPFGDNTLYPNRPDLFFRATMETWNIMDMRILERVLENFQEILDLLFSVLNCKTNHSEYFEFSLTDQFIVYGREYNIDNQTFFAENDIFVSSMKQFPYNCSNTVAFKADLFLNWKNDLKCSANVNWRCSNIVDYRDRIIGRFPRDVIENQSHWT